MAFIIIYNRNGLSYWHPNNNFYGSIKDIIGFSSRNYFTFSTSDEANKFIRKMFMDYNNMEGDPKLANKLFKIMKKMKVYQEKG